uniref:ATP-dependent translocase ABCB1-like isoform X3 n=1 Tax=Styela clava TaxID=7725 RepID=UPI00193A0614|nr:ATP-dependent translocase ABCB1-like isoform X3 [Styela clava]
MGEEVNLSVISGNDVHEKPPLNGQKEWHVESTANTAKLSPVPTVPFYSLFRFANGFDYFLLVIGSLASAIHGASLPLLFIFFGDLTNTFTSFGKFSSCNFNYTLCTEALLFNGTESEFQIIAEQARDLTGNSIYSVYWFIYIGLGVFIVGSIQVTTFCFLAIRQTKRIRLAYVKSILRQDIGYHDVNSSGELNARLADDILKIQDGMGEKLSLLIQYICMVISLVIVAFIYSWKLALVALSLTPMLVISTAMIFVLIKKYAGEEIEAYGSAGSIAEETISAIRTVVSLGIQDEQSRRYSVNLTKAREMGIKKGTVLGLNMGFTYLTTFSVYAITFWYGVQLIIDENDPLDPGDMMVVFFNVLLAALGLGAAGSNMEYISTAKVAGMKLFSVIERVPVIDIFSEKGIKPENMEGNVVFKNVEFSYPSRPETQILKGVNFKADKGQTVALVGQSGCGKSTSISLIQRFYDVAGGAVMIDGNNVKNLNLRWLRDRIGIVAQEPVLFDTTIGENIRYGKQDVTDEEIHKAAKLANADNFISALPKKYETLVGESGSQLSGGQKQRIAIARAIVRDPKIMLLDEATSALDTESEYIVQSALEKASAGRTTIVIAHRLSTIKNANKIIVFHDGQIVEEGTHDELLENHEGAYSNLINSQMNNKTENSVESKNQGIICQRLTKLSSKTSARGRSNRNFKRRETQSIKSGNEFSGNEETEEDVDEEEEEELPDAPISRIMKLNKPEAVYIGFGCFFSAVSGSLDPINALIFSAVLTIFTEGNVEEQGHLSVLYSCLFLALGATAFISNTLEAIFFSKSGTELTIRLREKAFRSVLRQDIAYFDDHRNNTGAVCMKLASDASRVQGCTGTHFGLLVKNFACLGVALGIAFAYSWKLTLLTIAYIPLIVLGEFLKMKLLLGASEKEKQAFENANDIATEAISHIRTVASLANEAKVFQTYTERLKEPFKSAVKKTVYTGIGYAFSQCLIYMTYAGIFRLGIELVESGEIPFEDVFKVLFAVIFGARAAGQNSSYVPDYAEAKLSAARMFKLFDSEPTIPSHSDEGHKPHACKGNIEFKSVHFTYPTRPDSTVLQGCNFSVSTGKTLALVGHSGCGKSTCIQLMERFYDATDGEVTIDGNDIKKLNVSWARQQIGIVSQEPVLFDISIKDNILYGDITRTHTDEEIASAAADANIHEFISSLPEGYDTKLGFKGRQLSGGQKQRIAIARALLGKPKLLLLDEATSALDTESEKVVQEALDKARQGRTSIIIAHRLSTVMNADMIAVVDKGRVVETGTHNELLQHMGAYHRLVNAQLMS